MQHNLSVLGFQTVNSNRLDKLIGGNLLGYGTEVKVKTFTNHSFILSSVYVVDHGGKHLEILYFCGYDIKKDMDKVLEDDLLKRTGYVVRECKLLESDRKGYFLYLSGTSKKIKEIDDLFVDLPIEKLIGREVKKIIKKIKVEEDSAATGMGMIFG